MEKDLLTVLESKKGGKKLSGILENLKEKASELLDEIPKTFPEFTPHNIEHKERILDRYRLLISDELAKAMNAYEIYFLIAATYLHDIGMADIPELLKDVKIDKSDNTVVQDYIREKHHERSETYILNNYKDFFIKNKWEAEIIGALAKGHRKVNLYDNKQYDYAKTFATNTINMPLLAALLQVADELDLTFERTPMTIYERITPTDKISKNEWERHVNTIGIDLDKEDPLTIRCDAVCESRSIHNSLKKMEVKINDALSEILQHLHHYSKYGDKIPRKFKFVIDARGYAVHDIKFSINEKEIMNLLLGKQLYSDDDECIREILKNAVDACRLKKEIFKTKFSPKISLELSPKKDILIIKDNGIGMDIHSLSEHFTKIGKSYYKSAEFLDKKLKFTPVSELGIGILSCFMIADKIEVDTKTDTSESLSFSIDGISDYFLLKEGTMKKSGTTVKLTLKKEAKIRLELGKSVKKFARHIEFPITVKENKKIITITDKGFTHRWKEFSNVWNAGIAKTIDVKITHPHIEGIISILGEKDNELGWIPLSQGTLDKYKENWNTEKRFSTSIEGILINNDYLIEWTNDKYIYMDINIKGNIVDLNIARNQIVDNEKFKNFLEILDEYFFNALEKQFKNLKPKLKENFKYLFLELYSDYFHYGVKNAELSKPIVKFFKRNHEYKCLTKNGLEYLTGDHILGRKKEILSLSGFEYPPSDEHLKFLWKNFPKLQEDKIYLSSSRGIHGTVTGYVLGWGFPGINVFELLKLKEMPKKDQFFGDSVQVVKFLKPKNTKFLFNYNFPYEYDRKTQKQKKSKMKEFAGALVNYDNKFVQLVLKNKKIIKGDRKMAFNYFCEQIRWYSRHSIKEIINSQKLILQWFIDEKIIKKEKTKEYLLTKLDFSRNR